jgi:hypothetical protein
MSYSLQWDWIFIMVGRAATWALIGSAIALLAAFSLAGVIGAP